jgi:hypothetical protein
MKTGDDRKGIFAEGEKLNKTGKHLNKTKVLAPECVLKTNN